jgi:branched-chain amino acid transport system ATP-binding protein
MTEIVLTLNGVEAGYGGGMVLQGFNLEVKKGSITCIVGPNGAGKSTVFRVISGLLKPNKGEVNLSGKNISGVSPSDILGLGIDEEETRFLRE